MTGILAHLRQALLGLLCVCFSIYASVALMRPSFTRLEKLLSMLLFVMANLLIEFLRVFP